MQIDWITVAAQLVNFLVLIWLLNRFLYGPITKAIERREAGIAARIRDAETARQEADRRNEALFDQRAALTRRQDEIMDEARNEARSLRERLEREARGEVLSLRRAWREQVEDEKKAFLASIRQSATRYVGDLARAVLKEFAGATLEDEAARRFADRLRTLDEKSRRDLVAAAEDGKAQVVIESSFQLSEPVKTELVKTVREVVAKDLDVGHAEAGDLLLGLRLRVGGRKVTWTLADYFDRLEERIDQVLRHAGPAEQRHVA
jgi:F-type H+-transporting ATPase subunit b